VRNDIVMVGRALAEPLPEAIAEVLGPSAAALLGAVSDTLRAGAAAARAGESMVPGDDLPRLKAGFEEAVERVRRARLTAEMTFDPAARVFGLVFAVESLLSNLADLSDRIEDMASRVVARPTSAPSA
jgi:hypothetical protein